MFGSNRNLGRLACLLAAASTLALAQGSQTATIAGDVVDGSGKPIAGAYIKVTSPALQGERQIRTDANGRFRAPLLPPGEYRIQVSATGLNTAILTQRVGVEQSFTPHIVLKATTGATVEVVAMPIAADKSEFKEAVNFTKETIDNLPVSRSGLLDIAYLAPSVVQNVNSDRGGVQIRGSLGTGNLFLVDGQNVQDNLYNGQRIGIIFDAVEETQVLTGAIPAEYGDVEGGVVNSITKSGGDKFTADLRWDLSNPAWNAIAPMTDRATPNLLSNEMSLQVGGPIIKSKLWFFAAGYSNKPNVTTIGGVGRVTADNANPGGFNYNNPTTDLRRELKLTWAVNDNNSLTAAYNNNDVRSLKDYGAGEFQGLTALHTYGEFYSVALRSILGPSLTMNARYGEKKQLLEGGGLGDPANWILYNEDDGYVYNNGWFNPADPAPDHRNNKTANVKFSYFWDGAGSHQSDFGMDYYQGITTASGDQGPGQFNVGSTRYNVWDVNVYGLDTTARTATVDAASGIDVGEYHPDKVTANTLGFYLNDKWTLDNHWNFQIGARFDRYDAKSASNGDIASHSSFSPRLGAKFDILGDSAWVVGLSFARYNGRVLETVLQNVSYVNNEIWKEFPWIGPSGSIPFTQMYNLANYDLTAPYTIYAGPVNVRIPSNLKPQSVDESQASLTHAFRSTALGTGYVKVTLVDKKWNDLIDYTQGNSGQVDYQGQPMYIRIYQNNPNATRAYKAMELEGQTQIGSWKVGGNIVWSSLKGNYEGETSGSPGKGQGLDFFRIQDSTVMYNGNDLNPSGYLTGDVPIRMRLIASYEALNSLGKLNWGFAYRFDSGAHYSWTRRINRDDLNPLLDQSFGSSATQYYGQERGDHVGSAQAYLDLSVQQDFQVIKVGSRAVNAFVKLDVRNVFNHTQILTVDETFARVPGGGSLSSPWVAADPTFGSPAGPGNYGTPREVRISTGVKF